MSALGARSVVARAWLGCGFQACGALAGCDSVAVVWRSCHFLAFPNETVVGENMVSRGKHCLLAAVIGVLVTVALPGNAQAAEDMIGAVSGGTMSPHVELRLNLSDGAYHLIEPADGKIFQPLVMRDGHISKEALADLRTIARNLVITGFKTTKCKNIERSERRRDARLAQRGRFMVRLPSIDSQSQFWVNFEGKSASAPTNEECWLPAGVALRRSAFQAVHSATSEG
jgi:hypothetical protein